MRHALTLLAAACLAPLAAADEVRVPGNGKLPTEVARTKLGATPAWVAHGGKKFLAEPGKAATSDAPAAKYMESYYLAAGDPDPKEPKTILPLTAKVGEKSFVMLVKADGERVTKHVGWVAVDEPALLREPKCLDKRKVNRKAMVVNSLEMVANRTPSARYYLAPNEEQPKSDVKLFVVYFVYAEAPDYLLLGTDPRFTPGLHVPEQVVLGWMKKDRLCEWDTREGLAFEPRTLVGRKVPGDVFKDEEAALSGKAPPEKILVTERVPKKSEAWKAVSSDTFTKMYLAAVNSPDLEKKKEALVWAEQQDSQNRLMRWAVLDSYPVDDNVLHKIGVAGTVTSFDDVSGLQERAELRERVESIQDQVNQIDIMFVLCDGTPMTTWLKQMEFVTKHVIENRAGIQRLRVGVLLYNDTKDPEIKLPLPLRELRADENYLKSPLMKALQFVPRKTESNTSPVHQALIEAAIRLRESPKHTWRLIVLCGHNGSPAADARAGDVADELVGNGTRLPIEVLAIHMKGNANAGDTVANFKSQLDEIKALVEKRTAKGASPAVFKYAEFASDDDAPRALAEVKTTFNTIRDNQSKLNNKLKGLRRGESIVVGEAREDGYFRTVLMKRYGFTEADIKMLGEQELFGIGYVWKRANGHDQVRYEVLTKESEIRDVIRALGAMKAKVNPAASFKDLMRAGASQLVTAQTGDRRDDSKPLDDEEMDRILEKEYGLNFQSALFKSARGTDTKIEKEHYQKFERIFKKNEMLKDLVAGNLFEYEEKVVKVGGFDGVKTWNRVGNAAVRAVDRKFSLGGVNTKDWFWIHFDEEWP